MKNRVLLVIVAICSVCAFANIEAGSKRQNKIAENECVLEELAGAGLGDVKYSILSVAQFQAVNGPEWVLLKGQSKQELGIADGDDSVFNYLHLETNVATDRLPDSRGLFFRVKNNSSGGGDDRNDGFENPDGEMLLGQYSEDKLKAHFHRSQVSSDRIGNPDGSTDTSGSSAPNNSYWRGNKYLNANTHPTTTDGQNETSPKNMTVNAFVKVKRKCLDGVALAERRAAEARIQQLEGYILKNQCDACLTMSENDLTELRTKNQCFKAEIDDFEAGTNEWSVTCQARTIGNSKKVLMLIGANNRTQEETEFLSHLDNQYPYYNVIEAKK